MSVRQRLHPRRGATRPAIAFLGSLLLALAVCPSVHAVTYFTVNGKSLPVTITRGSTPTVAMDVAQPGTRIAISWARDMSGTGKYDPAYPLAYGLVFGISDGANGDSDSRPGRIQVSDNRMDQMPAGSYVVHIFDASDGSTLDLPGWTVVPRPQPQGISGRVLVGTDPAAVPPRDAVIWAYRNPSTPVASASLQPDGRYTLPLTPGTYIVFAEWFGNLRSQRQVVTVAANQPLNDVNLPLLQGQEVSGTIREGDQPLADVPVEATAEDGRVFSTKGYTDGSYVLVLPFGQYRIAARGATELVTVGETPVDGIDFPAPPSGAIPATGAILTVAGNGVQGFGGDGRPATSARLASLAGLAFGPAGHLYLADPGAQRIRRVDAMTGRISTIAGSAPIDILRLLAPRAGSFSGDGGPATAATFNAATTVAFDAAGNLYIGDTNNHRVRKVDPQGIVTTVAGSGPTGEGQGGFAGDGGPALAARLNGPLGMAVDSSGNLYIADRLNHRVRQVSPDGKITTVAGGGGNPVTNGARATEVALNQPGGLAVDINGSLHILEIGAGRILKLTPAGTLQIVAGTGRPGFSGDGGPAARAQINGLYLAVDSAGNLYFADPANHRIRQIGTDGTIRTIAGTGTGGFNGDGGPARRAQVNNPSALAIDAAGNLYFSDVLNRRLRKVFGIAAPGLVAGQ